MFCPWCFGMEFHPLGYDKCPKCGRKFKKRERVKGIA